MANTSLIDASLSKEVSTAIKGLLILLVVFGHNTILCYSWEDGQRTGPLLHFHFLYTFHAYCFFILPFFYSRRPYQKGNIRKNAIRLLYPYLWVMLLCLTLSVLVAHRSFEGWAYFALALINGGEYLISKGSGFFFPWFLPAMFSLLLLKDVYYSASTFIRVILVAISLAAWAVVLLCNTDFRTLGTFVPFALVPAFSMLPICLLRYWLARRISCNFRNCCLLTSLCMCLFALFGICWATACIDSHQEFYFLLPVVVFLTILQYKPLLAKCRLLVAFGTLSMPIYLYNVIVYNALLTLAGHMHCQPVPVVGIVLLLLTLLVSYLLARITTRVPLFQRMLFPSFGPPSC